MTVTVGKTPRTRKDGRPTVSDELRAQYIGKVGVVTVPVSKGIEVGATLRVIDLEWRYGKLTASVVGEGMAHGEGRVEVGRMEF